MDYQMDIFVEHLVSVKKSWRTLVLQGLVILTAVIITYIMFSLLVKLAFFASMAMVGVWYGVWFLWKYFEVEYEYAITNGELDIDRIYGQKKREKALTVRVKKFELMAKVTSDYFQKCKNDSSIKGKFDYSSHENIDGTYFALYSDDTGRKMIFFEPTDQMLDIIRVYIPNKLYR